MSSLDQVVAKAALQGAFAGCCQECREEGVES